ncbi:acylphosphatase [Leifsonia sp. NPDC058230]|uniref:acylphosphatase n=1 Tax=Leifsonia sp. NPDC058230 TaxID=3346391 RepID=UPI0036DE45C1
MIRRHAIVTGTVQGVGFRWSAREMAHRLDVSGFARNRLDGTVEVEVEGEPEEVDRMLGWLRTGPPGCRVESVTVTEVAALGEDAFRVRETQ